MEERLLEFMPEPRILKLHGIVDMTGALPGSYVFWLVASDGTEHEPYG